jgi:hypothetical protein
MRQSADERTVSGGWPPGPQLTLFLPSAIIERIVRTRFPSATESHTTRFAAPKLLYPLARLATGFGLAAIILLFTGPAYSQGQAPEPGDVDTGKVQPLDLKPGCWEVRLMDMERVGASYLEISPQEIPQLEEA